MDVYHTLICFFFLTLQDGNIGLINAEIPIYTKTEGQNITIICPFTYTGRRTYFCKDKCKEDILELYDVRAQSGRYIMEYENTSDGRLLHVTITQLTKSDSGRYRCALDKYLARDPYKEFKIIVTGAPPTSKPKLTRRPSLTSFQSASTPPPTTTATPTPTPTPPPPPPPPTPPPPPPPPPPPTTTTTTTTTTQSFRRSSTLSSPFAKTTNQSEEQQNETSGGSGVLLYVGLTLVVIVLLFIVAVLIFYKRRATKHKEHPVETEYVIEANRVYEEIREDVRQSRSPPVEISSTYSAKVTKPNGVQTSDDYSFITATASYPLNKTEDDSSELVYTQVDRSSGAAPSHSSAPCGHADNVIYSAPRIHTEAQTDAKNLSQPLYSTVNFSQQ